jgi:hypothetical protein
MKYNYDNNNNNNIIIIIIMGKVISQWKLNKISMKN